MTLSYTKNLHLAVPDFLTEPWHGEFAEAMDSIDEIVFHALIAQDIDLWHNGTAYSIGSLVISPETGGIFSCAVVHTSSPLPQTFAQEMIDHPTFWTPLGLRLATQAEAEAGTDNTKYMTPLRTAQAIAAQGPDIGAVPFSTGDAKLTFKTIPDISWIMADDGSIGDVGSNATTRNNPDTLPLFTLLYNNITSTGAGVCTITIASPGVVNRASHGLSINQKVVFSTTGQLPLGIVAGTAYYVVAAGFTVDSFRVSATMSGAAINTTGTQSGTHTVTATFNLALQDSTGTQVARSVDAATDFASNRRLVIPKTLGRALAGAGQGTGLTLRRMGIEVGSETDTQTVGTMASHVHVMRDPGGNPSAPLCQWDPNANMTFAGVNGVGGTGLDATGGGLPANNMQPTQFLNVMIKL